MKQRFTQPPAVLLGQVVGPEMDAAKKRAAIMRATLSHFDAVCDALPTAAWIDLRMTVNGCVTLAATTPPVEETHPS